LQFGQPYHPDQKGWKRISIDDSGAPIKNMEGVTTGVVLVFRDITERRKAEKVLHQMEERNRLLADILEHAVTTFWYRITGWKPGDREQSIL